MLTEIERKELARNIRHRLADMLGSQWSGALDAAMDEMLLDEIGKFVVAARIDITDEAAHDGKSKEEPITSFVTRTGKDLDPETWARLESIARAARTTTSKV